MPLSLPIIILLNFRVTDDSVKCNFRPNTCLFTAV